MQSGRAGRKERRAALRRKGLERVVREMPRDDIVGGSEYRQNGHLEQG
jgi:hypothetical protein